MVKERDGLLGRLREAFRPQIVEPQKEYVRHTPEEREAILAKAFGVKRETETEPSERDRQ